jgi:hypothetical protein
MVGARCVPGGEGGCDVSEPAATACTRGPTEGLGARARAERTTNMRRMFVTLDVSQLSGWLNAVAYCRIEKEATCDAGPPGRRGGAVGQRGGASGMHGARLRAVLGSGHARRTCRPCP